MNWSNSLSNKICVLFKFSRSSSIRTISLEQLNPDAQLKIALIHYPPLYSNDPDTPFSELLAEAGVDLCVYGHIHLSKSGRLDVSVLNGRHRKVLYQLVSCDTMGFVPWELDPRKLKRRPDFLEGAEATS